MIVLTESQCERLIDVADLLGDVADAARVHADTYQRLERLAAESQRLLTDALQLPPPNGAEQSKVMHLNVVPAAKPKRTRRPRTPA